MHVNLQDIIIGTESCDSNIIITLLSYGIFKLWCQEKFDNVNRNGQGSLKDVETFIKSQAV